MSKKLMYVVGGIIILALFCLFFFKNTPKYVPLVTKNPLTVDYKATVYTISGQPVIPGSTPGISYFGNEVRSDINGDGRVDITFLITKKDGDKVLYYAVAGINTPAGYLGSQAVLIGDRIAPQTIEARLGPDATPLVIVNYSDRKAGEAFTVAPSVGKSLVLKFSPKDMAFGEVVQGFEGDGKR